jgi:hypothetical protein
VVSFSFYSEIGIENLTVLLYYNFIQFKNDPFKQISVFLQKTVR